MPKQVFDIYDFLGPVAAALVFAVIVLLISFFLLNFLFIRKEDDLTCFERVRSIQPYTGNHSLPLMLLYPTANGSRTLTQFSSAQGTTYDWGHIH